MRYRWKKVSVIFFICCMLLNGCGAGDGDKRKPEVDSQNQSYDSEDSRQQTESKEADSDENSSSDSEIHSKTKNITFYTIDDGSTIDKTVSVLEDTEITPEFIVQLVVSDLIDQSYVIEVNKVTKEDTYTVVDFSSSTPPVLDVGKDTENAILDAFAFSILGNIPDCTGVIYRVDGQAYVSNNNSFDYNQVYVE